MKNMPWVIVAVLVCITLLAATIAIIGFYGNRNRTGPSSNGPNDKRNGDALSSGSAQSDGQPSDLPVLASLPEFRLTDQTGRPFGTNQLFGKTWVANFLYASGKDMSPLPTSKLAALQTTWDEGWTDDVLLVSIFLDPDEDSSKALAEYAQEAGADTARWKFLTGPREAIRPLLDAFRLPVVDKTTGDDGEWKHSATFALVDPQGEVRAYYDSKGPDALDQIRRDIARVLRERYPYPDVEAYDDPSLDILDPPWLAERQAEQLATRDQFGVLCDFTFQDRLDESGITFRPQIVDEQRKLLQVNHFDHGNGIAVADVDGDGLYDIYFVSQVGGNQLWRNLGGGRFENVTQAAGVALEDRVCVTASFADIDNDGDADLFVTSVRGGNALFENDGAGHFVDITREAGVEYSGHSSTAVFFDFDRDGLLDLFLVNVGKYTTEELITVTVDATWRIPHRQYRYYRGTADAFGGHLRPELAERSILYRNLGGNRFADVSESTGLVDESWSGDATPMDANGDGWPDLYVLNMQGHDHYYENQQGKSFVDKTAELFPKTPWGSMGVKLFDYDNDGRMDLYLTDMHSDMSEDIGPEREKLKSRMQWLESFLKSEGKSLFGNAFYHRLPDGSYEEISDQIGAENYWPWGISVADLNADGFDDVFVASSMCFPYRYGVNTVLLNDRGQMFRDSEFILGVEPRRDGRTAQPWFVLECAGIDKDHRFCQVRDGRTVVWSAVGTRSSVVFDLDDDGDLDIVTNEFNSPPMLLISNLAQRNDSLRFLKIRLVGTQSNRDGLGASVRVFAAERSWLKVHDGKSGYLSQSRLPLYFGLSEAESVDRIEVTWPSGVIQTVAGPIAANRLLEIREEK